MLDVYNIFLYPIIIYPILFILPAYCANGAPVIFKGKRPLDFNKKINGKRIFGKNKTVRGTISSIAAGIAIGLIEYPFMPYMLPIAILMTIGANAGDLIGSFAKRMSGTSPGKSIPVLDQYGFFVAALLFALPFWNHFPTLYGLVFIIALTGIMHLLTNMGAYRLKLKDVPW